MNIECVVLKKVTINVEKIHSQDGREKRKNYLQVPRFQKGSTNLTGCPKSHETQSWIPYLLQAYILVYRTGNVYSLEYPKIPSVFFMPHHRRWRQILTEWGPNTDQSQMTMIMTWKKKTSAYISLKNLSIMAFWFNFSPVTDIHNTWKHLPQSNIFWLREYVLIFHVHSLQNIIYICLC